MQECEMNATASLVLFALIITSSLSHPSKKQQFAQDERKHKANDRKERGLEKRRREANSYYVQHNDVHNCSKAAALPYDAYKEYLSIRTRGDGSKNHLP